MSTTTPNGDDTTATNNSNDQKMISDETKVSIPPADTLNDATVVRTVSSEKVDPGPDGQTGVGKTAKQKRTGMIQFLTLCWCLFILGWNDGTLGPLLPRIREVYNVGFTVVSLTFVSSCAGFILGAFLNMYIGPKLGLGKVMAIGAFLQVITYSVQAPAPPFPAFVVVNALNGMGLALQDAQANGFVGALTENAEAKMGVLHAAYGLGAFASPLVSTQFAQHERWSFHYLTSLGLALSNTILVTLVFRLKRQDDVMREAGEFVEKRDKSEEKETNIKEILSNKAVHFLALFILIYVGVEVTIGGWIVTYIIEERGGGPSAGYISSGFFGGLTLGRVILLWVNEKVGERLVLYIYGIISLGLEFVVWFVPSLIGGAVAVSFIGLLMGPMYPLAMNHASRVLPRRILTSSIGWIAGFGQAGSALIPFMTGAISQKHGIKSLHPLLIAMMAVLVILWWLIPNAPQRSPEASATPSPPPELAETKTTEK